MEAEATCSASKHASRQASKQASKQAGYLQREHEARRVELRLGLGHGAKLLEQREELPTEAGGHREAQLPALLIARADEVHVPAAVRALGAVGALEEPKDVALALEVALGRLALRRVLWQLERLDGVHAVREHVASEVDHAARARAQLRPCLLYTSPSPRD